MINDVDDLILMINESYQHQNIRVAKEDIQKWNKRKVFNKNLWIGIKRDKRIIASGIAEYDIEIKEGILEWIQVLLNYKNQGYGKLIVNELLKRLKILLVMIYGIFVNLNKLFML